MPDSSTATERLIAFENRYKGRHAEEHALTSGLDERELHQRRVDETYSDFAENTKKAFDHFCRCLDAFCKEKGYSMFNTDAKLGEAYLQAQRLEGLRLGHKNVGKNVEIQLNQLKKLCTIRCCPDFSKDEIIHVITKASEDSAQVSPCRLKQKADGQEYHQHCTSAGAAESLRFFWR